MKQLLFLLQMVVVLSIISVGNVFSSSVYTATALSTCAAGVPPTAIIDLGQNQTVCPNQTASFNVILVNSTAKPASFTLRADFSDGSPFVTTVISNVNVDTFLVSVNPTKAVTYSVVSVSDGNGITNSLQPGSALINVKTSPALNLGGDKSICPGSTLNFQAPAGNVTYTWNNGSNAQAITISPIVNTDVICTVVASNGCSSTDTASITVNTIPTINAGPDKQVCTGDSVQLTSSGGVSYMITAPGFSSLSNPVWVKPTVATQYVVIGFDANGCMNRDTVDVTISTPVITANNVSTCQGVKVNIPVTSNVVGTTYTFFPTTGLDNPNIANPNATLDSTKTYTVLAKSPIGCISVANVTVNVTLLPTAVFIPTSFGGRLVIDNTSQHVDSCTWDFGDDSILIEAAPIQKTIIHDYIANGKYNVILTTKNVCGTATAHKTTPNMRVGLNDLIQGKVSLYPNPVTDYIIIDGIENISDIQIFSINGAQIYNQKLQGESSVTVDVSNFAYGDYIITFIDNSGKSFSEKFIKQ